MTSVNRWQTPLKGAVKKTAFVAMAVVSTVMTTSLSGCAVWQAEQDSNAASQDAKHQRFDPDPRIVSETLDNGLSVYLVDTSQNLQQATARQQSKEESHQEQTPAQTPAQTNRPATSELIVRLVVHTGSVDEADDQLGVAHMLEHMVFHETEDFPEGLHARFKQLGWMTGREINAVTREELTQFYVRLAGSDAQIRTQLTHALAVLSNIATKAAIQPAAWQQERQVVLNEWRRSDPKRDRVNRARKYIVRDGSQTAQRPTIGTYESINAQTADQLRAFYRHWYQPNNMSLVITSALPIAEQQALVAASFGRLEADHQVEPFWQRSWRQIPVQPRLTLGTIERQSALRVVDGVRLPLGKSSERGDVKQRMIEYVLRKALRAQLYRQNDALDDAFISMTRSELDGNTQVVGFVVRSINDALPANEQNVARLLQRLRTEVARLQQFGIQPEYINKEISETLALATKLKNHPSEPDAAQWQDRIVNALIDHDERTEPVQYFAELEAVLSAMTADDVNQWLSQHWLSSADRFFYVEGIDAEKLDDSQLIALDKQIAITDQQPAQAPLKPEHQLEAPVELDLSDLVVEASKQQQSGSSANISGSAASATNTRTLGTAIQQWALGNGDSAVVVTVPVGKGPVGQGFADREAGSGSPELSQLQVRGASAAGYGSVIENGNQPEDVQRAADQVQLRQLAMQLGEQSGLPGWSEWQFTDWKKRHGVHWSIDQSARQLSLDLNLSDEQAFGNDTQGLLNGMCLIQQWRKQGALNDEAMAFISDQYSQKTANIEKQARQQGADDAKRTNKQRITDAQLGKRPFRVDIDWSKIKREQLDALYRQQMQQPVQWLIRVPQSRVSELQQAIASCMDGVEALPSSANALNSDNTAANANRATLRQSPQVRQVDGKQQLQLTGKAEHRAEYQGLGEAEYQWSVTNELILPVVQELAVKALKQRLRQELQGIYSARFALEPDSDSQALKVTLSFETAPQRLDEIALESQKVLESLSDRFTDADIQRVLDFHRQRMLLPQAQPILSVQWLDQYRRYEGPLALWSALHQSASEAQGAALISRWQQALQHVSVADVRTAISQWVPPQKWLQVYTRAAK
ncbi:M16 family metallopeptidase [Oceanobacter kriegii]|uniref:M16 family metallopeptidase n=1 Tax=Oceanobacter kriegii TaxID=64972 RepID=UPI00040DA638|nr:insulinase family protein [Oceanobacter kriegii]